MLYTPSNVEQKTSPRTGANYYVADLTDINGQMFEGVSSFTPLQDGKTIEGTLEQNGKYTNFKEQKSVTTGGKMGQMERVMEKKDAIMKENINIKQEGIEHTGSIKHGTELTLALLEAGVYQNVTEEGLKEKIRMNVVWYKNLYKNPNDVYPSSDGL